MRGVTLLAAAVLGGASYWGLQTWFGQRASDGEGSPDPEARAESAAPARPAPVLATQPRFHAGDGALSPPPPPEAPSERLRGAGPDGGPGPEPVVARQAPTSPPRPERATGLEAERDLARATFDSGDRERGARLLQEIYSSSKDRQGVDLSPEVGRLLQAETGFERQREYLQYLARVGRPGQAFEDQLARAARSAAAASDAEPEPALRAWDELSLAYELAVNPPEPTRSQEARPEAGDGRAQRRKVLQHLEPFIQRMIFSGRYTPLLKSYTIQTGDSLSSIAAQFKITADSLRRINGLKSDTIQPRQRLRVLAGEVKIHVDKSDFILWMTLNGRLLAEFQVGLGRDNATPTGTFVVRVRQKEPVWWRPGEPPIPNGDPRNILGSRWLGFQETTDHAGFGIHGTEDPDSLGKESSAGCVRMRNRDIEMVYDLAGYGTQVLVRS